MMIQKYVVPPRAGGADARVARTDDGAITEKGNDGMFYRLEEERNWSKYRTITEEGIREENHKSREIKENMQTLNGNFRGNRYAKNRGNKFSAPMFGGTARTRRQKSELPETEDIYSSDDFAADQDKAAVTTAQFRTSLKAQSSEGQSALQRSNAAVSLLQKKYEQNLQVVEQLHNEKTSLQREVDQLRSSTGADIAAMIRPAESDEPSFRTHGNSPLAMFTASEVVDMFDNEETGAYGTRRGRMYTSVDDGQLPHRVRGRSGGGGGSKSRGKSSFARASSASRMSVAASSLRRSVSGVSTHLQADADRYIQKRRLYDEAERMKEVEQIQYEQFLRKRQLMASKHGDEFKAMQSRYEAQHEMSLARMEQIRLEREQQLDAAKLALKKKLDTNKANMTLVTKNQLSWQERQEIDEAKRRDRIERRKQQLTMSSSLPAGLAENLNKKSDRRSSGAGGGLSNSAATAASGDVTRGGEFRAEDPQKVASKLARQQRAWEMKFEREKTRLRETHASKMLATTVKARNSLQSSYGVENMTTAEDDFSRYLLPMERREQIYAEKRDARTRRKHEREEQKQELSARQEQQRRQRIMKTRVPASKPTSTSLLREAKSKFELSRFSAQEQAMRRELERKEKASKEHAAVLKTIMYEREIDLRGKVGGYKELRTIIKNAPETAAQARQEYRQNLRAYKQRLDSSLQNRPSLIDRHDEWLARKRAANVALHTVANAVITAEGGNPGTDRVDSNDDDLFDAKEQILLGLRKS